MEMDLITFFILILVLQVGIALTAMIYEVAVDYKRSKRLRELMKRYTVTLDQVVSEEVDEGFGLRNPSVETKGLTSPETKDL